MSPIVRIADAYLLRQPPLRNPWWKRFPSAIVEEVSAIFSDLRRQGILGILRNEVESKKNFFKGLWKVVTGRSRRLTGQEKRRVLNHLSSILYSAAISATTATVNPEVKPALQMVLGLVAGEVIDAYSRRKFTASVPDPEIELVRLLGAILRGADPITP